MKRRSIFASLFGLGALAKAQRSEYQMYHDPQWKRCDVEPGQIGETADVNFGCEHRRYMLKAKNGECPVCGTMAKPWKIDDKGKMCNHHGQGAVYPEWESCVELGDSRLIRCVRCNNAFFQDAEK